MAKTPEWAEAALRASPRATCARSRARWPRSARSSRCRTRCSARSTASSRSGPRSRSRRCSARSACPAAASATATARWATSAARPRTCPLPGGVPEGRNPVRDFIPCARIADLLLQPGETLRLQRREPHLSRHPPRVLGGRQSVPPPPGPEPPAPRARPARHGDRARAVLDADGAPRRSRVPRDDVARAQRHRLGPSGRADHRDAARGRAGGRGAQRSRHLRRARGALRRTCARPSPRDATSAPGSSTCTSACATRSPTSASPRRRSTRSGRAARSRCRTRRPSACCSSRSAPIPTRTR